MTPDVVELLAPVVALIGVGSMILVGIKMRYNHKLRLMQRTAPDEVERLTEAVQDLHEHLRVLRDEMAEIQERVDFAERMLTSGKEGS